MLTMEYKNPMLFVRAFFHSNSIREQISSALDLACVLRKDYFLSVYNCFFVALSLIQRYVFLTPWITCGDFQSTAGRTSPPARVRRFPAITCSGIPLPVVQKSSNSLIALVWHVNTECKQKYKIKKSSSQPTGRRWLRITCTYVYIYTCHKRTQKRVRRFSVALRRLLFLSSFYPKTKYRRCAAERSFLRLSVRTDCDTVQHCTRVQRTRRWCAPLPRARGLRVRSAPRWLSKTRHEQRQQRRHLPATRRYTVYYLCGAH